MVLEIIVATLALVRKQELKFSQLNINVMALASGKFFSAC
jgi:hypothetical protein